MLRVARTTVCVAVAVLALGSARPSGRQQATFKSATALVEVDAVVLDKNGDKTLDDEERQPAVELILNSGAMENIGSIGFD